MKIFDRRHTIDYITLGFILFYTFILVLNWNFLPTSELDTPYHLLMGKMFADYDTVMLWDYYEYAPEGRPNLYPPLLHILLWWAHDLTGADWWSIGRVVSILQYPLSFLSVWFVSRKLFNPVTALASVVFLSVSNEFWFWQVSVAPTALIVALFPLFLYTFYQKKVLASIGLLSSFLYLHLGLPYIVILCIFLFSLLSLYQTRAYLKQFCVVTGISVLFFLPWVFHLLMYRDWLKFGAPGQFEVSSLFNMNVLTVIFFILGIVICLKKRVDLRYVLVLSACVGFLAVAVYGWRYRTHSPIINCMVAGIGFEAVYMRVMTVSRSRKVAAVVLLLLVPLGFFSVNCGLGISLPQQGGQLQGRGLNQPVQPLQPGQPFQSSQRYGPQFPSQPGQPFQPLPAQVPPQPPRSRLGPRRFRLSVQPTPLIEMLNSLKTGERPARVWQITNPEIDDLIQWVIQNTSQDEILHLENAMLADYLALFTGRRTDTGMYREVSSPELFQAIREGRKSGIIILEVGRFREQPISPGMVVLEQFGDLLVVQGMKPEIIPQEVPLHLEDLFILFSPKDSQIIPVWRDVISMLKPRRVYLGVLQRDVTSPEVKQFIQVVKTLNCEVGIAIIVEDPKTLIFPDVTSIRLIVPQEKISPAFIESVRSALDPKTALEIAVLGPPISENTMKTLRKVLPLVDRIVRHVPPDVESISMVEREQLGNKMYIQIDTKRGLIEPRPDELYMLLQAASRITGSRIIIEFGNPPQSYELLEFLRRVYAV